MNKAFLIAGLAYGDEGKGATVDFLCRALPQADLVVRYNGGPQAAHNVVTPEGVHHTFSQFGAGMLANPEVRTHLSRFMLVDPLSMMHEADALIQKGVKPWHRTTVDPRCVVVTPYHRLANRLRERARGETRHGSCGMGVGVAREWSLQLGEINTLCMGDLTFPQLLQKKLIVQEKMFMKEFGLHACTVDWHNVAHGYGLWVDVGVFCHDIPKAEVTIFEGAQGVLLDETHGIEPHRTWTDCTFANADALCDEADIKKDDRLRVGCIRTYLTRHGAGPLKDEITDALAAVAVRMLEKHNVNNEWQGDLRVAPMDFDLIRQSIKCVGGVDCLAASHMDVALTSTEQVVAKLEAELAPVMLFGYGPTAAHRRFNMGAVRDWVMQESMNQDMSYN